MNRNVPVLEIVSQQVKDFPSAGIRQFYIQRDCNWCKTVNEIKYIDVTHCNDCFKTVLMRFLDKYFTEVKIVLNYKHNLIMWLNGIAIIARIVDHFIDQIQIGIICLLCNPH